MNPITQQAPVLFSREDILNEMIDLIRSHFNEIDSTSEMEYLTDLLNDSIILSEDQMPHQECLDILNKVTTVTYLNVFLVKLEKAFKRYESLRGC